MKIKNALLIVIIAMISSSLAHAMKKPAQPRASQPFQFQPSMQPALTQEQQQQYMFWSQTLNKLSQELDSLLREEPTRKGIGQLESWLRETDFRSWALDIFKRLSERDTQYTLDKTKRFTTELEMLKKLKPDPLSKEGIDLLYTIARFDFSVKWAHAFTSGSKEGIGGEPTSVNLKVAQHYLLDAAKKFFMEVRPSFEKYLASTTYNESFAKTIKIKANKSIGTYNYVIGKMLPQKKGIIFFRQSILEDIWDRMKNMFKQTYRQIPDTEKKLPYATELKQRLDLMDSFEKEPRPDEIQYNVYKIFRLRLPGDPSRPESF